MTEKTVPAETKRGPRSAGSLQLLDPEYDASTQTFSMPMIFRAPGRNIDSDEMISASLEARKQFEAALKLNGFWSHGEIQSQVLPNKEGPWSALIMMWCQASRAQGAAILKNPLH